MNMPAGTGEEQNATVPGEDTFTNFAKAIAQATPTIREKLAQQLLIQGLAGSAAVPVRGGGRSGYCFAHSELSGRKGGTGQSRRQPEI